MATKIIIPRASGEGGLGLEDTAWGAAYFNTGRFQDLRVDGKELLQVESDGSVEVQGDFGVSGTTTIDGHILPTQNAQYDLGSAEKKIRHLYLSSNSLFIGDESISLDEGKLVVPSGVKLGGTVSLQANQAGQVLFDQSGISFGDAEIKPDPENQQALFFNHVPKALDVEGNPVTLLSADKLGLGTSDVLDDIQDDLKFKLLTDQNRFVIGTKGEGGLESGWYRFNDFQVKGATDIGAHPINPVDTRIYSDEDSFILFTKDVLGNRVAHLVGGDEEVSPNNALALGIAVKVDSNDTPEDIEFVHTDLESYSLINGDSDSLGTNGLPIRQGFQSASIGANPAPLLIDGGYF